MKSKNRLRVASVVLAVAATCWHASWRVSTGPDAGNALDSQRSAETTGRSTIRVATFNIHSGKGRDGRRDLDRTAQCLQTAQRLHGFDLVGLNEVRGRRWPRAQNQAEALGRRLKMAWLFAPTEQVWYGFRQFGNGLLCRLPVSRWQRIPLPRKYDRSFRNVLLAEFPHGGQTVRLLVTHICQRDPRERRQQLDCVLGLFLALEEPAILMGDLNSKADDPALRRVLDTPGVVDALGAVVEEPPPGLVDWILVRGFRPVDGGIRDEGASDHPLVWAELEFSGERETRLSLRVAGFARIQPAGQGSEFLRIQLPVISKWTDR